MATNNKLLNCPPLRFPEFSDEWKQATLGEVLSIGNGKDYKHLSSGNIPVFGTGGYMTSVNMSLMDGESVFIGRKGTIDKPFYYNGKFWVVDTLFYTHSYKGAIPKFILYITNNINWLEYNEASGVPSLSKSTIQKIPIRLPTLPEQQKIATFLSLLDERIEAQRQIIKERKAQKKALLNQLFSQSLRFPGFDDEWTQTTLGKIGYAYNGLSGKCAEDFGKGKPYITYKMVYEDVRVDLNKIEYVFISETEDQSKVKQGDILFTTSSETPDETGLCSVLTAGYGELYLNSFCFGYRLYNENLFQSIFLGYVLRSPLYRLSLSKLAQGSTRYNISKKEVMRLPLSLPSLAEQERIANFLSLTDERIEVEEMLLQKYEEQKRYLLRKMFV